MFCAPSNIHNTHNITPLLVHPLLPPKQQDCQCCDHYCHLFHLALLVSFEKRSPHTFDAHSRPRVWPINGQKLWRTFPSEARGFGTLASEKMSNVVCRAAGSSLRCCIWSPLGEARIWYRNGQNLIRWLHVDRRLRHFHISAQLSDQLKSLILCRRPRRCILQTTLGRKFRVHSL